MTLAPILQYALLLNIVISSSSIYRQGEREREIHRANKIARCNIGLICKLNYITLMHRFKHGENLIKLQSIICEIT